MHTLIGLLSDSHGNSLAFERGVSLLLKQGAQQLYFLGDAIGYIPSTAALDSLVRLDNRVRCVRGNHEAMLLDGYCDPVRERIYQLETLDLTAQHLEMISSWPAYRRDEIDGLKLLLVHGSPADPTYGYVYPDTDLADFKPNADWVFMGNTHHPFVRKHEETYYVNIGSCGMPRDDGRYGSAALLDTKEQSIRILRFDITMESRQVLKEFPTVHPTVQKVYERRRSFITGDIL